MSQIMERKSKIFTAKEFVDAIRKNGLPKSTHAFFYLDDGLAYNVLPLFRQNMVISACAVGQACINLGIDTTDIRERNSSSPVSQDEERKIFILFSNVGFENDTTEKTLPEIADWVEQQEWFNPDAEFQAYAREYKFLDD